MGSANLRHLPLPWRAACSEGPVRLVHGSGIAAERRVQAVMCLLNTGVCYGIETDDIRVGNVYASEIPVRNKTHKKHMTVCDKNGLEIQKTRSGE